MMKRTVLVGTVVLATLGCGSAWSAGKDLLKNPLYVALGTFIVDTDTTVSLDGEAGQGSRVDLEKTFGDDSATRIRLDAYWRFAERHKIRAMVFNARADRTRILDEEINWGDEVFPVSASVTLERDFDIYELAYEYAFLHRENWELTGSAGLHWTSLKIALAADLTTPGGGTRAASDSGNLDLPLPVLGLRGLWNPGGDFWIDASAQVFSLSFDEYDGRLTDYRLAALWQPLQWLGIGLGYNLFKVDLDVEKDRFRGSLEWQYDGPQLFLSGTF